jgi:hypothetical protein
MGYQKLAWHQNLYHLESIWIWMEFIGLTAADVSSWMRFAPKCQTFHHNTNTKTEMPWHAKQLQTLELALAHVSLHPFRSIEQ